MVYECDVTPKALDSQFLDINIKLSSIHNGVVLPAEPALPGDNLPLQRWPIDDNLYADLLKQRMFEIRLTGARMQYLLEDVEVSIVMWCAFTK